MMIFHVMIHHHDDEQLHNKMEDVTSFAEDDLDCEVCPYYDQQFHTHVIPFSRLTSYMVEKRERLTGPFYPKHVFHKKLRGPPSKLYLKLKFRTNTQIKNYPTCLKL